MGARVRVEKSVSRSGLHMRVSTYFAVGRDCSRASAQVIEKTQVRPTYARGEAYELVVVVPPGALLVHLDMRRNPKRRVRGDIAVYGQTGEALLRAVYRKLKIRVTDCRVDQKLAHTIVKCVVDLLKLPVKRYGLSRCKA